jgi:UDP-N-acetylmuramate dehydrogenase
MRSPRSSRRKESCLPSDDRGFTGSGAAERLVQPRPDVALAPLTTLGVGGPAQWYLRAETADDVGAADEWCRERDLPMFVLGGGSNVVIADRGLRGLVVQMAIRGTAFDPGTAGTRLVAGAGESWDPVVAASVERGLAGLECLSGIPGTVGGTPIQNVGAYGQEVAGAIESVVAYDRADRILRNLAAAECLFAYRMSRFKRDEPDRFIVCSVTFLLHAGRPTATYPDIVRHLEASGIVSPSLADVRRVVLEVRQRKGMVLDVDDTDTRSVGSFFMNPIVRSADCERLASIAGVAPPAYTMNEERVKLPAAWLIERAGFHKGETDGPVAISTKHTLALVNRGGATARDVLRLATRIKRGVLERFGIWLRPEPVFVGFENDPEVEFLQAQR